MRHETRDELRHETIRLVSRLTSPSARLSSRVSRPHAQSRERKGIVEMKKIIFALALAAAGAVTAAPQAEIDAAIARGVKYLLAQQAADG